MNPTILGLQAQGFLIRFQPKVHCAKVYNPAQPRSCSRFRARGCSVAGPGTLIWHEE